jgi:3-phenylpropionate/trans-cinnamate dioxygenase ferredoxin reductase component
MIGAILVIGGGQAGAQAIDTLRREGYEKRIILVSDEPQLPYQRPPLSKKFLSGELTIDRLLFRHQSYYDEHGIELKVGITATSLDPLLGRAILSDGEEVFFDQALLCLGSRPRPLTCPGANLGGSCYLRSIADVSVVQASLKPGARIVIIGGGYIGLETAATACQMGCSVTILEMANRVMNRVVSPIVSNYFESEHRTHGVNIVCNASVIRLEGTNRAERAVCADGSTYEADLIVVGIGAIANVQLAREAGLNCDNGIVVDEHCRTSNEAIYAAGDCTNHPSLRFETRVRLESVDNAFEQGKAAALNMLGKPAAYDRIPWFWSDQFDNKLLMVGLSQGHDEQITRGDPASKSFSVCYLKAGELVAVEAVNHSKDYMAARKLIADRTRPDVSMLSDTRRALKDACF